jgi:hypothetical protein
MINLSVPDITYLIMAFVFQSILICHFALRKFRFEQVIHYGWIVYAAGIPFALVSLFLLLSGASWYFYLGGFIYLLWAVYGYIVEYVRNIEWRSPIRWAIFGPYITSYLAAIMFFWWPVALIYKPLWYLYGVLFLVSTILNLVSHQGHTQYKYKEGVT